jgi:tetratricopeptide (TPR) repeat protein
LAYYKSRGPVEAIQPLKIVIATDPTVKNAYLILADCYLQTGQSREAVSVLEPREAMFGEDLAFAYVLGTALLQTGDEQRGQQYIDRIFRAGDSAEGHLLMGTAHLNRFDYPAARKELERALQLNARLPTANSAYGRALLGLADQPEAEKAFRRELAVNVNDFESNLHARKHAQERPGLRQCRDLSGACRRDSSRRSDRAQAAGEPEAADWCRRGGRPDPAAGDRRCARQHRGPRPTGHGLQPSKRKDDANREREIVDR